MPKFWSRQKMDDPPVGPHQETAEIMRDESIVLEETPVAKEASALINPAELITPLPVVSRDVTNEQTSPDEASKGPIQGEDDSLQNDPIKQKQQEIELAEQTNLLPFKQLLIVFFGMAMVLTLAMLDQTITATLIPTLAKDFNSGRSVSWVATAYLLTSTALQPLVGRMSDIWGRKRSLLLAIFIFWAGSLASSVAQTMTQLIVFRAIQGIGGGPILSLVMITMSDVVSLRERSQYQGYLGIFVAVSNGLGPLIGGVIGQKTTWRWAFWLNLPISVVAFLVIAFLVPLKHVKGATSTKMKQVDWGGSAMIFASSLLILLALQWAGGTYPWDSAHVLAPLVVGIVAALVFVLYEWRIPKLPIIPLRLMKGLALSACYFITFTNGMIYYIQIFYIPQYFQILRGKDPIDSGLLTLPLVIGMLLTSSAAGWVVTKTGKCKLNICAGWILWTISLGLLSTLDENTSTGKSIGLLLFTAIGCGQTFQTTLVAIQASVEKKDMAVATSFRNFIRLMGATLALAISATILSNTLRIHSSLEGDLLRDVLDNPTIIYSDSNRFTPADVADVRSAYRLGFQIIWYMNTGLAGLSVFASIFFLKNDNLNREGTSEEKEKAKAWLAAREARRKDKKRNKSNQAVDLEAQGVKGTN